jgi:L-amino acid N-acyltransferase
MHIPIFPEGKDMDHDSDLAGSMGKRDDRDTTGNSSNTPALKIHLRPAAESDLHVINDIYNYYVLQSTCTYQEQPELICDRQEWFHHHTDKYPVTVAEYDGRVVGWSSLSPYRPRTAYRHTVENSIYIHHDWQRRGIGSLLLQDLIQKSRALGHHAILAVIDSRQTHSIALHEKYNFQRVGHLKHIGLKFGQWLDAIFMELLL